VYSAVQDTAAAAGWAAVIMAAESSAARLKAGRALLDLTNLSSGRTGDWERSHTG
jgi:hypothetical protein